MSTLQAQGLSVRRSQIIQTQMRTYTCVRGAGDFAVSEGNVSMFPRMHQETWWLDVLQAQGMYQYESDKLRTYAHTHTCLRGAGCCALSEGDVSMLHQERLETWWLDVLQTPGVST